MSKKQTDEEVKSICDLSRTYSRKIVLCNSCHSPHLIVEDPDGRVVYTCILDDEIVGAIVNASLTGFLEEAVHARRKRTTATKGDNPGTPEETVGPPGPKLH